MKLLTLSLLLIKFNLFTQTISIGIFNCGYPINNKVKLVYEDIYGVSNVTITDYVYDYTITLPDLLQHDVIILNAFYKSIPVKFADDLVQVYDNNKHLVLSTEGSILTNGERVSSYIWNKITNQNIIETFGNSYGTATPPRIHPSNGPGGLSQNKELTGSTTTYASFANINSMNVLHQRTSSTPNCINIEALDALFPHIPQLNKGTIYINGEIYYPFYSQRIEVLDLAHNIAKLHHTILTNKQVKLGLLNEWASEKTLQFNFSLNEEDVKFKMANVFTPNNDNINDELKIEFKSHIPTKINLNIFNRWGNIVYSTQNINFIWNGKDLKNNNLIAEGVYFYTLNATFENDCKPYEDLELTFNYKGNISIFR